MELKTIETERVPVRYYEAGAGRPLVFLHGAGGLDMDLGFLDSLAQKFHVYAPLVPGYGDSEECAELTRVLHQERLQEFWIAHVGARAHDLGPSLGVIKQVPGQLER